MDLLFFKYSGGVGAAPPCAEEEGESPDDERKGLRRQPRYSVSARQPMSRRQKPAGQSMRSTKA
jgi:hypothetical protein